MPPSKKTRGEPFVETAGEILHPGHPRWARMPGVCKVSNIHGLRYGAYYNPRINDHARDVIGLDDISVD